MEHAELWGGLRGCWRFADNVSVSGQLEVIKSKRLICFIDTLCQNGVMVDSVSIKLKINILSNEAVSIPEFESFEEGLADCMRKAWKEGAESKLRVLDKVMQNLHSVKVDTLHLRIENLTCWKNWEDLLLSLADYSSIGIVCYRNLVGPSSIVNSGFFNLSDGEEDVELTAFYRDVDMDTFEEGCRTNVDIYIPHPVVGWQETLADLKGIDGGNLVWQYISDNGCIADISCKEVEADEHELGAIRIVDAFSENKFNLFRNYCDVHGIEYIKQLESFDFGELSKVKGMGAKKLADIRDRYECTFLGQMYPGMDEEENLDTGEEIVKLEKPFSEVHPSMRELSIDVLKNLSYNEQIILKFKANEIFKVEDLLSCSWSLIKDIFISAKRTKEAVRKIDSLIQKNIYEMLVQCLEKNETCYKMLLGLADGKSMIEIARENGYADRRNVDEKIRKIFIPKLVPIVCAIVRWEMKVSFREYVTADRMVEIYKEEEKGEDYSKILIYLSKKVFEFITCAEVFVEKRDGVNHSQEIWHKIKNIMSDNMFLSYTTETFNEIYDDYPYIDNGAVKNLLIEHGYKVYGDMILKGNDKVSLCEPIIAKYFPKGIAPDDYDRLIKLCEATYGERIVSQKIQNNNYLKCALARKMILCEKGERYISPQNVRLEEMQPLLEKVISYIDALPVSQVRFREVFNHFEEEFKDFDVTNDRFFHGILKYSYPQYYSYDRDWIIRSDETVALKSLPERIENRVMEENTYLDKAIIKKEMGVEEYTLNIAVKESQTLFLDGEGNIYSTTLYKYTEADIESLCCCIDDIMMRYRGYCNATLIFKQLKKRNRRFIDDIGLDNPRKLYGFIEKTLAGGQYVFSRPHILRKGIEIQEINWAQVVLYLLDNPSYLKIEEVEELMQEIQWSQSIKYDALSQIMKLYYRVSDKEVVRKERFFVSGRMLQEVATLLDTTLENGPMALANIDLNALSPISSVAGYVWNEYLLRSIAENDFSDKYRIIDPNITDYRYERGVIVKMDSSLYDLIDVVVDYWQRKDRLEVSELEMMEAMQEKFGWKKLPLEIKQDKERLKYHYTQSEGGYFQVEVK